MHVKDDWYILTDTRIGWTRPHHACPYEGTGKVGPDNQCADCGLTCDFDIITMAKIMGL